LGKEKKEGVLGQGQEHVKRKSRAAGFVESCRRSNTLQKEEAGKSTFGEKLFRRRCSPDFQSGKNIRGRYRMTFEKTRAARPGSVRREDGKREDPVTVNEGKTP